MLYYLIPEDRSSMVKLGCRLVSVLIEAGFPAAAVTSSGRAPQWFSESVPVISKAETAGRAGAHDWIVFGGCADAEFETLSTNRALHCFMETDCRDQKELASTTELWISAPGMRNRHVAGLTTRVRNVGMHVHQDFFYDGTEIVPNMICTRLGEPGVCEEYRHSRNETLKWLNLDSLDEAETAFQLKRGSFYLSLGGPGAPLAELEAMAAGCIVLRKAAETDGGCAHPGQNCVRVHGAGLRSVLESLAGPSRRSRRERLRHAAVATAARYTRQAHVRWLRRHVPTGMSVAPP